MIAQNSASEAMRPTFMDWEILFNYRDGYDNREEIMENFQKLWNRELDKIPVEKAFLSGRIYGRKGFTDGDEIVTSFIQTIERIETAGKPDRPNDLLCATTKSGSKYYFSLWNCSEHVTMMLRDLDEGGKLSDLRYHYLDVRHFMSGSQFY